MIIDTTIDLFAWVNRQIPIPYKICHVIFNNGSGAIGYIVGRTSAGIFFKNKKDFKENLMFAEWIPNKCVIENI